jgi:excinuclease ABC subunit C
LSQANISANKFKVCLEYHIKNCKGPCEALQTTEDYNRNIVQAKEIIKGNNFSVIKMLKENMQSCADKYEFEKAQWYKSKIEKLERYSVKSSVVSSIISNLDVVTIVEDAQACYVNFMRIINGAVNLSDSFEIKKKLDENLQEIVSYALVYIQEKFSFLYPEVISNVLPELDFPGCEFLVPQRGDKKKLLDLSQKNALQFCKDKQKQLEATDPENHVKRIMQQMQKDLRLTEEPRHIECFDNSNFQGDFAVSAMTVFKDGKPSKKDYRHFNVKTVVGPDDFATMEEVIFRRYKRVLEENESLPQLIVIDGGKGQLSAACKSLEQLNLLGKVGIIGIAKRLEEIYYPGDSIPMYLDKRSESLKIIQQIRDEAHRFGITHHRNRRDKGTLKTELSSIKGISEKTSEKLLTEFKSVKRIKELSLEELTQSIGAAKAKLIFEYFTLKET